MQDFTVVYRNMNDISNTIVTHLVRNALDESFDVDLSWATFLTRSICTLQTPVL